jgi:hypothetical protein
MPMMHIAWGISVPSIGLRPYTTKSVGVITESWKSSTTQSLLTSETEKLKRAENFPAVEQTAQSLETLPRMRESFEIEKYLLEKDLCAQSGIPSKPEI